MVARWRCPIPISPPESPHCANTAGRQALHQLDEVGVNSRLDEVQAAILRVKLTHLDSQNARRADIARAYTAALADGPLHPPASGAKTCSATYITCMSRVPRIATGIRRHSKTTELEQGFITRSPSTYNPPMPAESPSSP